MPSGFLMSEDEEEAREQIAKHLARDKAEDLARSLAQRFFRDRLGFGIEQDIDRDKESSAGWQFSPKVRASLRRPGLGLGADHPKSGFSSRLMVRPMERRVEAQASMPFMGGELGLHGGVGLDGNWGAGFRYQRSFR